MRVIGGGEGTQGSKEGGGSEKDKKGRGKWPWTRIIRGRTVTPPTGEEPEDCEGEGEGEGAGDA